MSNTILKVTSYFSKLFGPRKASSTEFTHTDTHTHTHTPALAAVLGNRHRYSLLMHRVPELVFINLKCRTANISMYLIVQPFSVFDVVKRKVNRQDIF